MKKNCEIKNKKVVAFKYSVDVHCALCSLHIYLKLVECLTRIFFIFVFVYACTNVDKVELREYLIKEMLTTCVRTE